MEDKREPEVSLVAAYVLACFVILAATVVCTAVVSLVV